MGLFLVHVVCSEAFVSDTYCRFDSSYHSVDFMRSGNSCLWLSPVDRRHTAQSHLLCPEAFSSLSTFLLVLVLGKEEGLFYWKKDDLISYGFYQSTDILFSFWSCRKALQYHFLLFSPLGVWMDGLPLVWMGWFLLWLWEPYYHDSCQPG